VKVGVVSGPGVMVGVAVRQPLKRNSGMIKRKIRKSNRLFFHTGFSLLSDILSIFLSILKRIISNNV
jgi:hypothetical protein